MILLVDLCYKPNSLSYYEFVLPVANILKRKGKSYQISHYTSLPDNMSVFDGFILCGTALMDNSFAKNPDYFSWVKKCKQPLLGICAGMQILVSLWGGKVIEKTDIGMNRIRVVGVDPLFSEKTEFDAYELHKNFTELLQVFDLLAVSKCGVEAVKLKTNLHYGVMFHPEVRNEWVVERFSDICLENKE